MSLLKLAFRNLRSKPERFWPMAVGVFLLAFSVLHSLGSFRELHLLGHNSLQEIAAHQAQIIVIPRYSRSTGLRQSFQTLTSLMKEIKRIPGVGRVDQMAQFFSADVDGRLIHIAAVIPDPDIADDSSNDGEDTQISFDSLSSLGSALLGSGLTDYPVNSKFDIAGYHFTSAGVRKETNTNADKTVYLSYETAAAFLQYIDLTGRADIFDKADEQSLIVTIPRQEDSLLISNRILHDVKNVYLFDGHSFFTDESKSLQAVQGSAVILQMIIPGGLMLGLAVLFSVSVLGRKRELSVMRAMGASTSLVRGMLLLENGIIGLLGGVAALLAFTLYQLFAKPGTGLPGSEVLAGIIVGVAGILAATWFPATVLSRRDPTRFMKG